MSVKFDSIAPFDSYSMDLGFIGSKIILVLVDNYNGYTKLFLIPNKSNKTIYETLYKYFDSMGLTFPENKIKIHSDKGSEFSLPNDKKYDFIEREMSLPYQSHIINFKTGEIEQVTSRKKNSQNNSKYEIPIDLHTTSMSYPAESKIRSMKNIIQKMIIETKNNIKINQELLNKVEDIINNKRQYFIQESVLKPGVYWDKEYLKRQEEMNNREVYPYKYSIGDMVYVKAEDKDDLQKKSFKYKWTPFKMIIVGQRRIQKVNQYQVSTISGDVVAKWFYENQLKF